jgi:hypothetical protein
MNKLYGIVSIFMLIAVIVCTIGTKSYADKNNNIIEDIFLETNSQIVECGLKISLQADNNGEKECVNILEKLKLSEVKTVDYSIFNNDDIYSIEFKSSDISGYIQYNKNISEKSISIVVIEKSAKANLYNLKQKLDKIINYEKRKPKYFLYIKGKTELSDITKVNKIIVGILKKNNSKNINTIELDNSTSTTALTGEYEPMKNGNELIDFNSAVCNYSSGNYVIIGTPIIMQSY